MLIVGALAGLSMAPLHIWPLLLLGLGTLFIFQYQSYRPLHAFIYGWLFGFGYFVVSLNWIGNALLVEGNEYKWAWPLAVSGLPALLSFFSAFALYSARRFFHKSVFLNFLAFLILVFTSEWLRGHIFTGFPWNLYGYSWGFSLEMIQIIHLGDVYLLSALTLFWGGAIGYITIEKNRLLAFIILGLALVSITATYVYGYLRLANAQTIQSSPMSGKPYILLVQPNIDQSEKWQRDKILGHFEKLLALSKPQDIEASQTLIIWPETALNPVFLENELYLSMIRDALSAYKNDVYIIAGALIRNDEDESYSNSIVILNKNADIVGRYDKTRLVPFGEYIPFQQWIPLETITQFSGFRRGQGVTSLDVTPDLSISPLVCYEILFPSSVIAKNNKPDMIVNVTNDAWYGFSAGPHQHLLKARFRAIEEHTPVIRAANTGISAIIDPYGRYLIKTELFKTQAVGFTSP